MASRKLDLSSCTLIELAYARTGSMLKAARVVAFVSAWGVVRDELGHEPTMEEYGDFWRETARTAYRAQALFREVFPGLDSPAPVLAVIEDAAWRKRSRLDLRGIADGRPLTA